MAKKDDVNVSELIRKHLPGNESLGLTALANLVNEKEGMTGKRKATPQQVYAIRKALEKKEQEGAEPTVFATGPSPIPGVANAEGLANGTPKRRGRQPGTKNKKASPSIPQPTGVAGAIVSLKQAVTVLGGVDQAKAVLDALK